MELTETLACHLTVRGAATLDDDQKQTHAEQQIASLRAVAHITMLVTIDHPLGYGV